MALDPSFDFVILVRREVIRVAEHDVSKSLVPAHADDLVQVGSADGGTGYHR